MQTQLTPQVHCRLKHVVLVPARLRMSVGALFRSLQDGSGGSVLYAQAQNNRCDATAAHACMQAATCWRTSRKCAAGRSMPEEFGPLMEDIAELPWATEAFGEPPEATNLWIGGERSVTSFHKARLHRLASRSCAASAHFVHDAASLCVSRTPTRTYMLWCAAQRPSPCCRLPTPTGSTCSNTPWQGTSSVVKVVFSSSGRSQSRFPHRTGRGLLPGIALRMHGPCMNPSAPAAGGALEPCGPISHC